MPRPMKIDFVSDVSCPWCIIGLRGLEEALARTGDLIAAEITFQPFELNPQMRKDGQNLGEHVAQKYGSSPEQSATSRAMIRDRAADVGFTIAMSDTSRIYNTFDAHRLLHWAQLEGKQAALKHTRCSKLISPISRIRPTMRCWSPQPRRPGSIRSALERSLAVTNMPGRSAPPSSSGSRAASARCRQSSSMIAI